MGCTAHFNKERKVATQLKILKKQRRRNSQRTAGDQGGETDSDSPIGARGEFENAAIPVAIAVNENEYHEVLRVSEDTKEDKDSRIRFFPWQRSFAPQS